MVRLGEDTVKTNEYQMRYQREMQRYSQQSVTACERAKANEPWTPDEIEILFDPELSAREKCDILQRTYFSIVQAGQRYKQLVNVS